MAELLDELVRYGAPALVFMLLAWRAAGLRTVELSAIGLAGLLAASPIVGRALVGAGNLFDRYDIWGETIGTYQTPTGPEWARWGGCADRDRVALHATSTGVEPRLGRCKDTGYVHDRKTALLVSYGQALPKPERARTLAADLAAVDRTATGLGGAYVATLLGACALAWAAVMRGGRAVEAVAAAGVALALGNAHGKARIDERALQEVAAAISHPGPSAAFEPAKQVGTGGKARIDSSVSKPKAGAPDKSKSKSKSKARPKSEAKGKAPGGIPPV
jgi:hypothetical protein